jgi:hypothetical protein
MAQERQEAFLVLLDVRAKLETRKLAQVFATEGGPKRWLHRSLKRSHVGALASCSSA